MVNELRLVNFKSFSDASLKVWPFTVIVGSNAIGKGNIGDAFRFVHGIGRGYNLVEIIGGRYVAGGLVAWAQLRGAANDLIRFGKHGFRLAVGLTVDCCKAHYAIEVGKDQVFRAGFRIRREELKQGYHKIYTSHPGETVWRRAPGRRVRLLLRMEKTGGQRKYGERVAVWSEQPALTHISSFHRVSRLHNGLVRRVFREFCEMRFLDLVPDLMR